MKIPPTLLRVRFGPSRRAHSLWLPLILVWPLVLLLLAPLLFLGLLLVLVLEPRSIGRFIRSGAALYELFCELRGTHVALEGRSSQVFIALH